MPGPYWDLWEKTKGKRRQKKGSWKKKIWCGWQLEQKEKGTFHILRKHLYSIKFYLTTYFFIKMFFFSFVKTWYLPIGNIGILLPKLFWPNVRKNCSSDQEKLMKLKLKALDSLFKQWKVRTIFETECFLNLFLEVS